MLKKYADDIRNKMEEKDKILFDHKKGLMIQKMKI